MTYLKVFIRLLIGAVFIASSWGKLAIPLENFEEVLRSYQVFPEYTIFFLSRFVPWTELLMGLGLIFGLLTRLSLMGSAVFFSSFIFVISRALLVGLPIQDCGCFGPGIHLAPQVTLGMDIPFLALTLWLLFSAPTRFRLDSAFFRNHPWFS